MDTQHTIDQLHRADERITAQRNRIKADPDDAFDKLVKFAVPSAAGLLAGKLAEVAWKRIRGEREDGILASMLFAALSAAIGSLITSLATRGSASLTNARHRKKKA